MSSPEGPVHIDTGGEPAAPAAEEAPERIKSMIGDLRKRVARMKEINDEERAIQHMRADVEK